MTPAQIAAVLGNVYKESGFNSREEDLSSYANTSNDRIRIIFPTRVAGKSNEELNAIKKDPKKWGEFVYGKSIGNIEPGDGFKYRGRGFIQLTGRGNYAAASKAIFGDDRLVKNPDMATKPDVAAQITAWYSDVRGKSMAKTMGVDLLNSSQEDLNRVYTSAIAGRPINADDPGYLNGEVMRKVREGAAQFLTPQQLANTPQIGVNVPAAKQDNAAAAGGNTVTIAQSNTVVGGAKSGDGLPYRDPRDYIHKAFNPDVFGIFTRSSAG